VQTSSTKELAIQDFSCVAVLLQLCDPTALGLGAGTIPTRTIPTATIPTSVIIVGLLSAYWRSPAPRSTCGTGRVRVRVRVGLGLGLGLCVVICLSVCLSV